MKVPGFKEGLITFYISGTTRVAGYCESKNFREANTFGLQLPWRDPIHAPWLRSLTFYATCWILSVTSSISQEGDDGEVSKLWYKAVFTWALSFLRNTVDVTNGCLY